MEDPELMKEYAKLGGRLKVAVNKADIIEKTEKVRRLNLLIAQNEKHLAEINAEIDTIIMEEAKKAAAKTGRSVEETYKRIRPLLLSPAVTMLAKATEQDPGLMDELYKLVERTEEAEEKVKEDLR